MSKNNNPGYGRARPSSSSSVNSGGNWSISQPDNNQPDNEKSDNTDLPEFQNKTEQASDLEEKASSLEGAGQIAKETEPFSLYDDLAKTLYDIKSLDNLSEDQEKLLTDKFPNFDLQTMSNVIASKMTEDELFELMESIGAIDSKGKIINGKTKGHVIGQQQQGKSTEEHHNLMEELKEKRREKYIEKLNPLIIDLNEKFGKLQNANDALAEKLAKFYDQCNFKQQSSIREIFELPEGTITNEEFVRSKLNVSIAENIQQLIDIANQPADADQRRAASDLLQDDIFKKINEISQRELDKIKQQELVKTQDISTKQEVKNKLSPEKEQIDIPNLEQRNSWQKALYKAVIERRQAITKNDSVSSKAISSWSKSSRTSSISDEDNKQQITNNIPESK